MPGRRRSHSEAYWADAPPSIVRCVGTRPNGEQCRREAEAGSVVCDQHGGAAPQVRKRAAERVVMTADAAAQNLVRWMNDPAVPYGVRVKIAQDLMDRSGLAPAQVHKVVAVEADPVETLFSALLSTPGALNDPSPTPPALPPPREDVAVVDAEVVREEPAEYEAEIRTLPTRKYPHLPPQHVRDGLR